MTRFVFIYHAPRLPEGTPPPSAEQMEGSMQAWHEWAGRVGEGMVDFGTPLAGGIRVTPTGSSPSEKQVAGYSIIEAADMDAARALAQGHPHLAWTGGCEIEVHEAQPVPGA